MEGMSNRVPSGSRWSRGAIVFAWVVCTELAAATAGIEVSPARQMQRTEKAAKSRELVWVTHNVDAPIPSLSENPPCELSEVLRKAGASASQLATDLERFTAEERIEYKMLDRHGAPREADQGTFNYVFAFEEHGAGSVSREYRTPTKGSYAFRASGQDTGQVALGLIFHPNIQPDYQMKCEGLDKRDGQRAWVVHFQQRKDKPSRTLWFPVPSGGTYAARLKGRAWISAEDFHVMHLETSLVGDIPVLKLENTAISVDYVLVFNHSQKIGLWLPGRIEAYWEFTDRRVILAHTYSEFQLFAVETEERIEKPKEP